MANRCSFVESFVVLSMLVSGLTFGCVAPIDADSSEEEAATSEEEALGVNNFLVGSWRVWEPHQFKLAILAGEHPEMLIKCLEGACEGNAIRAGFTRSQETTADGKILRYITFGLFPRELLGTDEAQFSAKFRYWFHEGELNLKRPKRPALVLSRAQKALCSSDLDCKQQDMAGFECRSDVCAAR